MAAAAQKLVDYAISQLGTAEDPLGSNKQPYGAMLDELPWYLYKEGDREWIHKVNGYDWCAQFVDASFITTFGIDKARKILFRPQYNNYGAVVKYAFNYFKAAGRGLTKAEHDPQPGDVIYFQNEAGLSHTGIVIDVSASSVTTVEGNSGKNCWYVAKSTYNKTSSYIYGYGCPDYSEDPDPQKKGWVKENGKWYFYKNGVKVTSKWQLYKGQWYYLESDGAMVTGWQIINDKKYYFYLGDDGHMAADEWIDGMFLDMSGAQTYKEYGEWKTDKNGKWWEDAAGCYPKNRCVRIEKKDYTFDKNGYVI